DEDGSKPTDWSQIEDSLREKQSAALKTGHVKTPPEGGHALSELSAFGIAVPTLPEIPPLNTFEQQLEELQRENTEAALKALGTAHRDIAFLRGTEEKILQREGTFASFGDAARHDLIKQIKEKISERQEALDGYAQESPEHFYVIKGGEARRWIRQLQSGRIARTPYVEDKIHEVSSALASGKIVFLHGETGAGKTEVARVAARAATGKDPIVVRGYSGMDSAELFGHTELRPSSPRDHGTIDKKIHNELQKWRNENPDASSEAVAEQRELIKESLIHEPAVPQTEFLLGAIYQAAQEGRTVILDEANYIPPPLLAKLNDILTKKPGEHITVQEDGIAPIQVVEGFSVIMTGNINRDGAKRYGNRYDIDAALIDRSHFIHYQSLPQATQGLPINHRPEEKQLFAVLVASLVANQPRPRLPKDSPIQLQLIDRVGSLTLPEGGLDAIWRLSQFAAVTQLAFAGKITNESEFAYQKNGAQTAPKVENALSPRRLINILESWSADGFQHSLDFYIKRDFTDQALDTKARDYLKQLGMKFGFTSEPSTTHTKMETITGDALLETIFGEIPLRQKWPDGASNEQSTTREQTATRITQLAAIHSLLEGTDEPIKHYSFLLKNSNE
ncbi:MAG: AAA family ATPase, partial [Bdellovibrionota bacterium]